MIVVKKKYLNESYFLNPVFMTNVLLNTIGNSPETNLDQKYCGKFSFNLCGNVIIYLEPKKKVLILVDQPGIVCICL